MNKAVPAWMSCPHCENYWCTIHEMHAHDCPCPPVEEWAGDPYSEIPIMPDTPTRPVVAVQLRLTPDERDRLRIKAAAAGMQMSSYVHALVMSDLDATPNGKKTSKKS